MLAIAALLSTVSHMNDASEKAQELLAGHLISDETRT